MQTLISYTDSLRYLQSFPRLLSPLAKEVKLDHDWSIRVMSSKAQEPEIISREELKTESKFLKLERIKWRDQDGKEVWSRCILQ